MDKINTYKNIIKNVITEIHNRYAKSPDDVQHHLIIDEKRFSYLLLTDGWLGESRFYGVLIHAEVKKDGKVWLHDDNTELIVVDWLLERGIPKKDIVIGWHAPIMREDTEFAVM